jgi:hypothetical protein
MSMLGNGVLILMASAALVLAAYNSPGQSLDDSAARAQLAEEITKKYGVRTGGELSLPQLYALIVGLNEIYSTILRTTARKPDKPTGSKIRYRPRVGTSDNRNKIRDSIARRGEENKMKKSSVRSLTRRLQIESEF